MEIPAPFASPEIADGTDNARLHQAFIALRDGLSETIVGQAGLVERHNFDGGHAVFELADGGHHDHMVCVDTGEVIEFFDAEIERRQKEIVRERGFELVDHNLVLYVRQAKK